MFKIGKIKNSESGYIFQPCKNLDGYQMVKFKNDQNINKSTSVHVLVALTWIPNRE